MDDGRPWLYLGVKVIRGINRSRVYRLVTLMTRRHLRRVKARVKARGKRTQAQVAQFSWLWKALLTYLVAGLVAGVYSTDLEGVGSVTDTYQEYGLKAPLYALAASLTVVLWFKGRRDERGVAGERERVVDALVWFVGYGAAVLAAVTWFLSEAGPHIGDHLRALTPYFVISASGVVYVLSTLLFNRRRRSKGG